MNDSYKLLKFEQVKGIRLLQPFLLRMGTATYDDLAFRTFQPTPRVDLSNIAEWTGLCKHQEVFPGTFEELI
jgi:hypothetical protein